MLIMSNRCLLLTNLLRTVRAASSKSEDVLQCVGLGVTPDVVVFGKKVQVRVERTCGRTKRQMPSNPRWPRYVHCGSGRDLSPEPQGLLGPLGPDAPETSIQVQGFSFSAGSAPWPLVCVPVHMPNCKTSVATSV